MFYVVCLPLFNFSQDRSAFTQSFHGKLRASKRHIPSCIVLFAFLVAVPHN